MPRQYTRAYREETTDRTGRRIAFRVVIPEDKETIAEGLKRMSPESRFLRFFSYREHLTAAELQYLTEIDYENHFALAVGLINDDGTETGLGIARFVRIEPPNVAEAAVAVVDDAQGHGIGRMLFERLVRAANERGVSVFRFEVLAENDAMLGLVENLFPGTTAHVTDQVVTLDCPLPNLATLGPAGISEGLLYRVLRLAAEGSIAVLRGASLSPARSLTLKRSGGPTELDDLVAHIGVSEDDTPAPS